MSRHEDPLIPVLSFPLPNIVTERISIMLSTNYSIFSIPAMFVLSYYPAFRKVRLRWCWSLKVHCQLIRLGMTDIYLEEVQDIRQVRGNHCLETSADVVYSASNQEVMWRSHKPIRKSLQKYLRVSLEWTARTVYAASHICVSYFVTLLIS